MTPQAPPDGPAPNLKQAAAERAVLLVEPGMKVGLGTGSTAAFFVAALGARVAAGLDVLCVPTSEATRRQADALGIRLTGLDEAGELDLTVDGADELDGGLRLIKGGGGALLREKIVAASSRRMVVIADETKRVERLGGFPLPVEIVPFGEASTMRRIARALADLGLALPAGGARRRHGADGRAFTTDGGNLIVDLPLDRIPEPEALAAVLKGITGVVEHGLFIGLADAALIGTARGVMEMARPDGVR